MEDPRTAHTLTDSEFRELVIKELHSKNFRDFIVPILLTGLIGLVGFFGSNWIKNVESSQMANEQEIAVVRTKGQELSNTVILLKEAQQNLSNNLILITSRQEQQAGDVKDVNNRLVKIETKLDFLIERKR